MNTGNVQQQWSTVLLASHDTPGARQAEQLAIQLSIPGGLIHHLVVVPSFWRGMLGDDWLNSGKVRHMFGKYVENQIQREIQQHIDRLRADVQQQQRRYRFDLASGDPAECLIAFSASHPVDIIVMGSRRPKKMSGLYSRMLSDKLFHRLTVPVMVAPYPP